MNLTIELQARLLEIKSSVTLGQTVDGGHPKNYAFVHTGKRQIRVGFASHEDEYVVIFYERTDALKYENCFARGLFNSLGELALAIEYWVGKSAGVMEIKKLFPQIELFIDFEKTNINAGIEKAWTKVKNMFFNDETYWKSAKWNRKYFQMLDEAKAHVAFKNYYPFTSHYCLRFAVDKYLKETWALDYYVYPPFDSSKGEIFVSNKFHPEQGNYFDDMKRGLDFYAEILRENKPIKWR